MVEELPGGAVQQRASELFGASADADKVPVDEALEHFPAGNAADGLQFGAGDGLAVSDDGESFDSRLGEPRLLPVLVEAGERGRECRQGQKPEAAGDPLDAEGATNALILLVQRRDEALDDPLGRLNHGGAARGRLLLDCGGFAVAVR